MGKIRYFQEGGQAWYSVNDICRQLESSGAPKGTAGFFRDQLNRWSKDRGQIEPTPGDIFVGYIQNRKSQVMPAATITGNRLLQTWGKRPFGQ